MKKNTVTIGVSAYNEEKNISRFISSLLLQEEKLFCIENILIVSDGSTDRTNEIVSILSKMDARITLVKGKNRIGKPARINQIFKQTNSEAVVILDADIVVRSTKTIENLVMPIFSYNKANLTSGLAIHMPPKTRFETVMATGLDMWNDVKLCSSDAEMYTCEGQIRAFSKELYKQLRFPEMSADDVFPYLYTKQNNLKYKFVKNSKIYYKLPSNFGDYLKQHIRYLHSKEIQQKSFNQKFIEEQYTIGLSAKLRSVYKYMRKDIVSVLLYISILLFPKILVHFNSQGIKSKWSIIDSTK